MAEPVVVQTSPMVQRTQAGSHWWCSCGRSTTQPFCDGSHKGTGLTPVKVDLPEEKAIAWCACKHTANAPFCDGSHSKVQQG